MTNTVSVQKCPLCGSSNISAKWKNVRGYQVDTCFDCDFLFLSEMPTASILDEYYSNQYFMADFASKNDLLDTANQNKIKKQAEEFDKLISKHLPLLDSNSKNTIRVAEIGCSCGYLLFNLEKIGYSVKGFELSITTAREGREKLKIDIQEGFFESCKNNFDVIILRHVLEHVTNPRELLTQIYDSLKYDGLFILEGPNLDSLSSKLFQSHVSWIAPLEHLTYPKFKPILKACSTLGFECVFKSTRRGRGISMFHQLLLNLVALRYGGKEDAKAQLGGINDASKSALLTFIKKLLLSIVAVLDFLASPVNLILSKLLLEEEMLIVFKKKKEH